MQLSTICMCTSFLPMHAIDTYIRYGHWLTSFQTRRATTQLGIGLTFGLGAGAATGTVTASAAAATATSVTAVAFAPAAAVAAAQACRPDDVGNGRCARLRVSKQYLKNRSKPKVASHSACNKACAACGCCICQAASARSREMEVWHLWLTILLRRCVRFNVDGCSR